MAKAFELDPETFNIAISLGPDEGEEMFGALLRQASDALISEILSGLVEAGHIEMVGVDETGDLVFGISEQGKQALEAK